MIAGYVGANILAQRNTEVMHERTVALQDANRVIEMMRNDDVNATTCLPSNTACLFPETVTSRYHGTLSGISGLTLADEAIAVTYTGATTGTHIILNPTVTVTWTSYTGQKGTAATEAVQIYLGAR